jgi:hypothetical protein
MTIQINYVGGTHTVPEWAEFLATDLNGRLHVYSREPKANKHRGMYQARRGDKHEMITRAGVVDLNWVDSLVRVEPLKVKPKKKPAAKKKSTAKKGS